MLDVQGHAKLGTEVSGAGPLSPQQRLSMVVLAAPPQPLTLRVSPCSGWVLSWIPSLSVQTPSKAMTREGNLQPFSLWGRKETIFFSLFQLLGAKYTSLLLLTVNTLEMPWFQAVLGCLFYLSLALLS